MDAVMQEITDGIKAAILAEGDGHHFYLMAARSITDPKGREVFETLAQEELEHARFLRAQYRSLLESGRPDPAAKLGTPRDLSGASPIFSDDLRDRAGGAHYEMSALSIGIQLELSSSRFYRDLAERATDSAVTQLFLELAAWEQGHHDALLRQQGSLREDYWNAGGFAPF